MIIATISKQCHKANGNFNTCEAMLSLSIYQILTATSLYFTRRMNMFIRLGISR